MSAENQSIEPYSCGIVLHLNRFLNM